MRDMFEETAGRIFGDLVVPELVVEAERGTWPRVLWTAVEDGGLTVAAVPETSGGVGASWHDAFVLVRAAGRYAAPVPIAETILVNWLLGLVGAEVRPGPATLGAGNGRLDADGFTGILADVPWGAQAQHVLTIAGDALILLRCSEGAATNGLNTARERRDTLAFEHVQPVASVRLPATFPAEPLLLGGAMIRAAQIAGALDRLLDIAIDYANQRVQFGRAIGKFQAIQHQIAVLAEQASLASSGAEMAFALSEAGPSRAAIAAAKSVASEAAGQGAAIAHAVLGAIGFTYEHSLHLASRRLWSWRSEFGSHSYWAQEVGRSLCHQGSQGAWRAITTTTDS